MGTGFRPVRGNWEIREFDTTSTATFRIWAPVTFGGARTLIEATSATTAIIGVATSASVDSFPAGVVQVAIPRDRSAVARSAIQTGVATSATSLRQAYNIEKSGNNLRIDTDSQASARVEIVGAVSSADSEVDVVFLTNFIGMPSYSSISIY